MRLRTEASGVARERPADLATVSRSAMTTRGPPASVFVAQRAYAWESSPTRQELPRGSPDHPAPRSPVTVMTAPTADRYRSRIDAAIIECPLFDLASDRRRRRSTIFFSPRITRRHDVHAARGARTSPLWKRRSAHWARKYRHHHHASSTSDRASLAHSMRSGLSDRLAARCARRSFDSHRAGSSQRRGCRAIRRARTQEEV